jgi:hypothetical protein
MFGACMSPPPWEPAAANGGRKRSLAPGAEPAVGLPSSPAEAGGRLNTSSIRRAPASARKPSRNARAAKGAGADPADGGLPASMRTPRSSSRRRSPAARVGPGTDRPRRSAAFASYPRSRLFSGVAGPMRRDTYWTASLRPAAAVGRGPRAAAFAQTVAIGCRRGAQTMWRCCTRFIRLVPRPRCRKTRAGSGRNARYRLSRCSSDRTQSPGSATAMPRPVRGGPPTLTRGSRWTIRNRRSTWCLVNAAPCLPALFIRHRPASPPVIPHYPCSLMRRLISAISRTHRRRSACSRFTISS